MEATKLAFVDCETTSLTPHKGEILDFGVVFEDGTAIHFRVKPERLHEANSHSLRVNGYNHRDWESACTQSEAAERISKLLDGHTLVGHNIKFDYGFLEETLRRHDKPVSFNYHTIDTISLAHDKCRKNGLTSMSLKNVCLFLGIEPEGEIHLAIEGAKRAKLVYDKLAEYK